MRYRKKPVVVEAMQFTEQSKNQCFNWVSSRDVAWDDQGRSALKIHTLEGTMTAMIGDWIIRGVKGEFYPIKADIFAETYEPAP